ncbi:hypothetical protein HAX54_042575 [Datura stramonium]|uniref:Uncharacterized protein n=1 Tax=Datura stramonium TaxID=4076 RepID=A0ABS8SM92_DATST|nr:hypothetical protein [Datura stramonium]
MPAGLKSRQYSSTLELVAPGLPNNLSGSFPGNSELLVNGDRCSGGSLTIARPPRQSGIHRNEKGELTARSIIAMLDHHNSFLQWKSNRYSRRWEAM